MVTFTFTLERVENIGLLCVYTVYIPPCHLLRDRDTPPLPNRKPGGFDPVFPL